MIGPSRKGLNSKLGLTSGLTRFLSKTTMPSTVEKTVKSLPVPQLSPAYHCKHTCTQQDIGFRQRRLLLHGKLRMPWLPQTPRKRHLPLYACVWLLLSHRQLKQCMKHAYAVFPRRGHTNLGANLANDNAACVQAVSGTVYNIGFTLKELLRSTGDNETLLSP